MTIAAIDMGKLASIEKILADAPTVEEGTKTWLDMGYAPLNELISGDPTRAFESGRLYEIAGPSSSGKTLLATAAMIAAQRMGGIAIFVDWEMAFNPVFAQQMGCIIDKPYLYHIKAETWESGNTVAFKIAEQFRSQKVIPDTAPIVIVFDSIAAAVPKSMLYDSKGNKRGIDEYTMNDTTALARVTSTTLKSVAQYATQFNVCALYLNQIRTKPGVVYGDPTCLRGDVMIPFVDGTSAPIETVVRRKIDKPIWSYNELTQQLEAKRIIGWHDNGFKGDDKSWVHIRTNTPETRNGVSAVTVTNDHQIYLQGKGWVNAEVAQVGDKMLTRTTKVFEGKALEFLKAVLAFDCSLVQPGKARSTACLSIQDNVDPQYSAWKAKMLSGHLSFTETAIKWNGGEGVKHVSSFSHELKNLAGIARNPLEAFKDGISPMQLAIAIMDDGSLDKNRDRYTLSLRRFSGDADYLEAVAELFFKHLGLTAGVRIGGGRIDFDTASSRKIAEMIREFVPPFMERKLPEDMRGHFVEFDLGQPTEQSVATYSDVVEVRPGTDKSGKQRMYDLTVEDNHNFLAGNAENGVLVHNCTPGGVAMEFYASTRIFTGSKKIMEAAVGGKEFKGRLIALETKKNKLTRPFQSIDLRLMYGDDGLAYFDYITGYIEELVAVKALEEKSGRVSWEGKTYFKGQLAKKVAEEGKLPVLVGMYLAAKGHAVPATLNMPIGGADASTISDAAIEKVPDSEA